MKQKITLIAAVASDNAIGRDGDLIWHIRDDMRHFRAATMGRPVIMGRRTFESLPSALPGRRNIMITSSTTYMPAGAEKASGLQEALAMCADAPEVMIIGGAQIYDEAMPLADELLLTRIDADAPDADVHFPEIDPDVWRPAATDGPHTDPDTGLSYSYITYRRL